MFEEKQITSHEIFNICVGDIIRLTLTLILFRRDGCNQSSEIDFVETNQDISIKRANQEGTSVSETNGSHISSFSPVTVSNADDELADSGDDVAASEMQSNAVSRRKLRMVIDLEDDD